MSDAPGHPIDPDPLEPARPAQSLAGGVIRLLRPSQWTKNVLVFAAPAAASVLLQPGPLLRTIAAALLFIMVSGGVYCVNDSIDAAADRLHPRKRLRPIASGLVPVPLALTIGGVLIAVAIGLSLLIGKGLAIVLATYVVFQLAYCFGLKREPVLELMLVASGFVLRMVAGGLAAGVPLSSWFLAVAGAGAMLVVTGKRLAEKMSLGDGAAGHRQVLDHYTLVFLQLVVGICGAILIVVYALWAFDPETDARVAQELATHLSLVPFIAAVLRYVLEAERGEGGAPEDVLLRHRSLQLIGLLWLVTLVIGVTRF